MEFYLVQIIEPGNCGDTIVSSTFRDKGKAVEYFSQMMNELEYEDEDELMNIEPDCNGDMQWIMGYADYDGNGVYMYKIIVKE